MLLALALGMFLASPARPASATSPTAGTQFQGDAAHTGVLTGVGLTPPLIPLWATGLPLTGTPVVGGGRVYLPISLGSQTWVVALSEANGSTLWGPVQVGPGTNGSVAYDAGRVFAVDFGCDLVAVSASTGGVLWRKPLNPQTECDAPVTATAGRVIVATAANAVYAVSESSGALLWTGKASGDKTAPSVTADGVYLDPSSEQVYDLSVSTGKVKWHYVGPEVGGGGRIAPVAGGRVYARQTTTSTMGVHDAATGALLFKTQSDGLPAIDAANGLIVSEMRLVQGFAACASYCTVVARRASDGVPLWSFAGDKSITTPPLVVDGVVYVASVSGNVWGLDETTGRLVWRADLGQGVREFDEQNAGMSYAALGAGDGLLLVPSERGIVAFASSSAAAVSPRQQSFDVTIGDCGPVGTAVTRGCSWTFTQAAAGSDLAHVSWDPAYGVTLTAKVLTSAGAAITQATSTSGEIYLTASNLAANTTYRVVVTVSEQANIGFRLHLAQNQPHLGGGAKPVASPTSIAWGSHPVGTSAGRRAVVVRNVGDRDAVVSAVTMSGSDANAFTVVFDSCTNGRLPPGWPCTVVMTATPQRVGTQAAVLNLQTTAGTQTVKLYVTGS
ncbi:MAG: hypothetical protein QOG53_2192 [Frankiales bacterium]|jgi:outer membrane protein assembly factor BamB|nr:hypothetical protein [Frankiales bacterium]